MKPGGMESCPNFSTEMGPQAPCDAERIPPGVKATLIYSPQGEGVTVKARVEEINFTAPSTVICPLLEVLQKQQKGELPPNGSACINCRRCGHNLKFTTSEIPQLPPGK